MKSSLLPSLLWIGVPLVIAFSSGCDSTERHEAEQLFRVMERFRVAENRDKPGLVKGIEEVPSTSTDIATAKADCLKAAQQLSKAVMISNEVDATLGQIEKDGKGKADPRAAALASRLDEAESLLKQGHQGMQKCETSLTPLRKKYAR